MYDMVDKCQVCISIIFSRAFCLLQFGILLLGMHIDVRLPSLLSWDFPMAALIPFFMSLFRVSVSRILFFPLIYSLALLNHVFQWHLEQEYREGSSPVVTPEPSPPPLCPGRLAFMETTLVASLPSDFQLTLVSGRYGS